MLITDVLKLECCTTELKAKDKATALQQLAKLVKRNDVLRQVDEAEILKGLTKREEQGSTGFGHAIAIPHCQVSGIDDFAVGLAVCPQGVDFMALDHKKVKAFVVIVGPVESRSGHLQLLATVSRIFKEPGIAESLLKQKSRIGLLDEFIRHSPEAHKLAHKGKEKLMLLTVHDPDIMDDISEVFMEYGIEEATIMETHSMQGVLSNVPLFLGFFDFTGGKDQNGKLIMVKLSRDHVQALVQGLEDAFGNLDDFTGLSLIVLDIFFSKGI